MRTIGSHRKLTILLVALGVVSAALATNASASRVVVTGSADIHVWVDDTWDVYPSYDDVVISLRAVRDCYATVFVVDTDGYVHVVRPLSPWDDAWIRGGRTYRYTGYDLGLESLRGRGVAHVFAIASPYAFDFSCYGAEIFVGGFGFRIYGDPYLASREIYLSLLPRTCHLEYVSVSVARFYIREWVRYPHYLCRGHGGVHVRFGDYCHHCAHLYDGYRVHVADPYPVIHPRAKFKRTASQYAEIKRSTVKYKSRSTSLDRARAASRKSTRRESVAGYSKTSAQQSRAVKRTVTRSSTSPRKVTGKVVSRKSTSRTAITRKPAARSAPAKAAVQKARKIQSGTKAKRSTSKTTAKSREVRRATKRSR